MIEDRRGKWFPPPPSRSLRCVCVCVRWSIRTSSHHKGCARRERLLCTNKRCARLAPKIVQGNPVWVSSQEGALTSLPTHLPRETIGTTGRLYRPCWPFFRARPERERDQHTRDTGHRPPVTKNHLKNVSHLRVTSPPDAILLLRVDSAAAPLRLAFLFPAPCV